jgi:hypothetical protein
MEFLDNCLTREIILNIASADIALRSFWALIPSSFPSNVFFLLLSSAISVHQGIMKGVFIYFFFGFHLLDCWHAFYV